MKIRDLGAWLCVAGACLAAGAIRLRLLGVPLERDEGEYAYIAQILLQGEPLYAAAHDLKSPGIFAAYALILLAAGQSHLAIHGALLLVNAATTALVFLIGRKLLDARAGAAAAVSYAALSLSGAMLGFTANAEPLLLLPACAGVLLLLSEPPLQRESKNLVLLAASGLALGVAITIKQNAAVFALFGLLALWFGDRRRGVRLTLRASRISTLLAGIILPSLVFGLALLAAGVFRDFWYWTIEFPLQYVTTLPPLAGLAILVRQLPKMMSGTGALWGLAGFGLCVLVWDSRARVHRAFVVGLLIASCAATATGLYFRSHYFLLLMPVLSLLIGIGVSGASDFLQRSRLTFLRGLPVAALAWALGYFVWAESAYLFRLPPDDISRAYYGTNPFPESLEIARYLADNTSPSQRISVLGSEPQIYFYAQRQSASPHILMYPLSTGDEGGLRRQDELRFDVEEKKPEYLVYFNLDASWLDTSSTSDPRPRIFEWFAPHVRQHYRKVGLVDVYTSGSEYFWDDEARRRLPNSTQWITVYKLRR